MVVRPAGLLDHLLLRNVGPVDPLDSRFAPRMNLFTGDNGLGKSFLLEVVWRCLTGAWAGKPAMPREESGPGLIKATCGSGEVREERIFPARKGRPLSPASGLDIGIFVSANGDASIFIDQGRAGGGSQVLDVSVSEIMDGPNARSRKFRFQGLISDWSQWQFSDDQNFEVFREVVRCLSPDGEPIELARPKRIAVEDSRSIPCLKLPYGEVPITHASAGMKRIISLAYLLVWAVSEHKFAAGWQDKPLNLLLAVDEIESHLHPAWQRLILPALFRALTVLPVPVSVQSFVTTHSPMIMVSTETLFHKPDDQLFLFELADSKVELKPQPWDKQGDASAWLMSDLFGLDEARSKPAERLVKDLDGAMDVGQLSDRRFHELDRRVAELLPEEDPLRARWVVWKLKREGRL